MKMKTFFVMPVPFFFNLYLLQFKTYFYNAFWNPRIVHSHDTQYTHTLKKKHERHEAKVIGFF